MWGRRAVLNIDNRQFEYPDFHMEFLVKSDDRESQPVSEVVIYNLNHATTIKLEVNRNLTFSTGYGKDIGNILEGRIDQIETIYDGPDRVTTLKVKRGTYEWEKAKINITYNKNTTAEFIIRDLANHMGMGVGYLKLKNNITYKTGKTISGKIRDKLSEIVKETKSNMKMENNTIYVYSGNGKKINKNLGFELNSASGLLSNPKLTREEIDGVEYLTYTLETLLMHQYRVDMGVSIDSETLVGQYRIESIEHNEEWNTKLTVVPLDQPRKPEQEEDELSVVESNEIEASGNASGNIGKFFQALYSMEGWSYSQPRRMQEGYADCSSLIGRAGKKAGLISNPAMTTRDVAGMREFKEIPMNQRRKGDVLWKSGHVAVCMGDGQTFEARKPGTKISMWKEYNRFTKAYRFTKA